MDQDQLKFLFVSVMLVLAVVGRGGKNNLRGSVAVKDIPAINLTAQAQPVVLARELSLPLDFTKPALPHIKTGVSLEPVLKVKAAMAKDLDSDFDFYKYNFDLHWPFASLTKLISALVAIENVGLDKKVTISESAIATESIAGNLEVGEQYSVGELVKAMLVVSSNDAAVAVAESFGYQNFIDEMQKKSQSLGMSQSIFTDPTGLSSHNRGTVGDLAKLVEYIYKNNPEIFKMTAQIRVNLFEDTKGSARELLNINSFASSRPDFWGGKTGFTDRAGGNLISIFNYRGHKILFIVLGTDDRFGQTDLLYNWIKEAYTFD